MLLEKGDKLVMIGDSITDCGRNRPIGEGRDALGGGYVSLLNAQLQAAYPELLLRIVNMGVGGNTVRDLRARWQSDVLDLKPDWLSIMIGINDVWRQFDQPQIPESHVHIEEYERTLRELASRTRPLLKGMVLMSPFYMEPSKTDAMRAKTDQYAQVVRRIAGEQQAQFVDTQAAFDQVLTHVYPASIGWDRVHPNLTGHTVIARAFLQAIGFGR